MKIKKWYFVVDNGDGSTSPIFLNTKKVAKREIKKQNYILTDDGLRYLEIDLKVGFEKKSKSQGGSKELFDIYLYLETLISKDFI